MSDLFPYNQLPISTVPDLSSQIERTTELIGRGGYGSVYKGRWLGVAANATLAPIAIKILELVPLRDEEQRTKRFKQITRELSLWRSIQHENILPLLGISRINDDTNVPAFVCPRMENGNAKEFCSRNPRFPPILILYDIIKGLHYLHTSQPEIVHGDIKAVNVLINNRCEACLCDFGLSRILTENTLWKTTATHAGGSVRWMAPELINRDAPTPMKDSDIYAYAMTCYEILSGDVPFKSVPNDMAIPLRITKGQRPNRTESFYSDSMWDTITRCWEQEPEGRLRTEEVLGLLQPKVDWKEADEALAKIGEKDAVLAKVEKEKALLKEELAKTEEYINALKEEKEKALEGARNDISGKERELNSLNVSLQQSEIAVEQLENQVGLLRREKDDVEVQYERHVEESQVLREQLEETVAMHQAEAVVLRQEIERAREGSILLTEDLISLRHTNSSLREEVERLEHNAQAREEETVALQKTQQNEIARLHEEVSRALVEAEKISVYVRTKYNLDEEALKTSIEQFEEARKYTMKQIEEAIAENGGMDVVLERMKKAKLF